MAIILISGGTGLVGRALTKQLISMGHEVRVLSRFPKPSLSVKSFYWNIEKNEIDEAAFDNIDHFVHLAGSGIADARWTKSRKQNIIDSRVLSMNLITSIIKKKNIVLKSFVGASATGIYGIPTSEKIFTELDKSNEDFLVTTCQQWESSYNDIQKFSNKNCVIRISVVLSEQGGALKRLLPLFKLGLGSAVGSGKQYMSWIHLDDLISIFCEALFNTNYNGVYNAVATEHINNNYFSKQLARSLSKPFWMLNVPGFLLKILFGEMANVLLQGSRVSNHKLIDAGFKFKYPLLASAFKQIVSNK